MYDDTTPNRRKDLMASWKSDRQLTPSPSQTDSTIDPNLEVRAPVRQSGAQVTKSVPLYLPKRWDDDSVPKKKQKSDNGKWTPSTHDHENLDKWTQVGLLLQRWYIDHGPVHMGNEGDERIRTEMWDRYEYVFGKDAPPLIDEKWDRTRWVTLPQNEV